jgi:hypothetical protein
MASSSAEPTRLAARESLDDDQLGDRPFGVRDRCCARHVAGDEDLTVAERPRPAAYDDRIAPAGGKPADGDGTIASQRGAHGGHGVSSRLANRAA